MNEKYRRFGKAEVFRNKSLLNQFLKEYSGYFGKGKLNPNCTSCRSEIWNKYIANLNKKTMEKNKCKYRLKAKYNGITMEDKVPIFNGEMTDEKAKELLLWHPAHELLFDILPEEVKVLEIVDNISETIVKKIPKKKLKKPIKRKPIKRVTPKIK